MSPYVAGSGNSKKRRIGTERDSETQRERERKALHRKKERDKEGEINRSRQTETERKRQTDRQRKKNQRDGNSSDKGQPGNNSETKEQELQDDGERDETDHLPRAQSDVSVLELR